MQIRDSVIVVTGGARGIGAAVTQAAAARGARVAVGDLDLDLARETARRHDAHAGRLDVSDPESWTGFLAETEDALGPVDALISNAGVMPIGRFADEADRATRQQIDVNVYGVIAGCRAVLPGMLERGRGALVNVASQAGKAGMGGLATYCATKYAVVGFSRALGDELAGAPVDVSCILPGVVDTELSRGMLDTPFTPRLAPSTVAQAIVSAVERPRREVWIPASGRVALTLADRTPRRVRERVLKLMGIGDPVLDADQSARADYEGRIAAQEPASRLST